LGGIAFALDGRREFRPRPAPVLQWRPRALAAVRRSHGQAAGPPQSLGPRAWAAFARGNRVAGGTAINSIADFLGDKPYLMGPKPCAADATVFSFVAGCLVSRFKCPIRAAVEQRPNLVAYRDRMMQQYFPDFGKAKTAAA
jgi:glutathione S-transferase